MLFSERMGLKQPKQVLQIDSMDNDLRVGLWNSFYTNYFKDIENGKFGFEPMLHALFNKIHSNYFKKTIDDYQYEKLYWKLAMFKEYFLNCIWNEVFDLIEFISQNFEIEPLNRKFINNCNEVLKRENSGFSIINKQVVPISSEIEIQEIEQSLINSQAEKLKFVNNQLNTAIEHFKNRENPDYRNSIKEAISAVEGLCREITSESTLGVALNKIEQKIQINPQFKDGLIKIYAFTNGKEGIRHAQMLDSNIGFDEAKFMLVFCSAFINYLISKWIDAESSSA